MGRKKSKSLKFKMSRNQIAGTILFTFLLCALGLQFFPQFKETSSSAVLSGRTLGDPNAPLRIIEYADFQCQECAKTFLFLHDFIRQNSSEIYLEIRYFPLQEPHSYDSALYAECAAQQGRFWYFVELLFRRQAQWRTLPDAEPFYTAAAQEAGLNLDQLRMCIKKYDTKVTVEAERLQGESQSIKTTPTCSINREMTVGYQSTSERIKEYFHLQGI